MSHLVLLSGWGCDARIWQALDFHWPAGMTVSAPNWPGYGSRQSGARPELQGPMSLARTADAMAEALPADAVWVGWSLGGLLAGALLDHLPAPRALVLLGMGPRFCHPQGVTEAELAAFRGAFRRDPDATRAHFLRWQLQGEPAPRSAHRRLLDLLGRESPAATATLAAGLDGLATLDITRVLAAPPCPVWRVAGEHDPLLPPSARADIRLTHAGHCPMLSRPEALAAALAGIAYRPEHSLLETTP